MKKVQKLVASFLTLSVVLVSCKKEEEKVKEPIITNFTVESEVGGGTKIYAGGIISFEFDVKMDNPNDKLKSYHIEIHNELESGLSHDEYKIMDSTYINDFDGLRNTHIHSHINVPEDAPLGKYHFHLIVSSQDGYTTSKEESVEIIYNENLPAITNFQIINPSGSSNFLVGDTLIVKFDAVAKNGANLKSYFLEIHDEPASGNIDDEYKLVDDEFTSNFAGLTNVSISHELIIADDATNGKYHVHLYVTDSNNLKSAKTSEIIIE